MSDIQTGIQIVKDLFGRYARYQNSSSIESDDSLNDQFNHWLSQIPDNPDPVLENLYRIYQQHELQYSDLLVLWVLFIFEMESGIKPLCASLRGNSRKLQPTASFITDLIFPTLDLKLQNLLPDIPHLVDLHLVDLHINPAFPYDEPELYINIDTCKYLSGIVLHSVRPNSFYRLIRSEENIDQIILDNTEKESLLELCNGYKASEDSSLCLLFSGHAGMGKHTMARALANHINAPLIEIQNSTMIDIDKSPSWSEGFMAELKSQNGILFIPDIHLYLQNPRPETTAAFKQFIPRYHGLIILTTTRLQDCPNDFLTHVDHIVDFQPLSQKQRSLLWKQLLPESFAQPGSLERISSKYLFSPGQITHAVQLARRITHHTQTSIQTDDIDKACKLMMHQSFDGLTVASALRGSMLQQLILPEKQHAAFMRILAAARNYDKVMTDWGFGKHLTTGKGLCVLFDGPPGTGKTFAAEVMANELNRPLQRVHMPNLVSKWVGETGENIAKLFTAAAAGNAILLLDEADALLSKRISNTSKSTDRYANMEINILLQEIERYQGITILTTNLENSLDEALERRIQFRVTFEKPDERERKLLWQTLIAPQAELDKDIDFDQLAELYPLSGGHIKNAILSAAYLACTKNAPISQSDLETAAQDECVKQGMLISESWDQDY